MKLITKYKAFDNSEFMDEGRCIEHESNCKQADLIISKLPEKPGSCDFSNGDGYIQHDYNTILNVRNKFLEFCKRYSDHKWIQETIDKGFDVDPSWAGRIIGECAPSYISRMWYRFSCIDNNQREWGQPYYANNPDQAKPIRLNQHIALLTSATK